jgi:hypothetical protein
VHAVTGDTRELVQARERWVDREPLTETLEEARLDT